MSVQGRISVPVMDRAWRLGREIAPMFTRQGDPINDRAIMWALLCMAVEVLDRAYTGPPRLTWPAKSTWPDAPDEVTAREKIVAYLRGDLDEMPADEGTPPMPDATMVSIAEAVMELWHGYALKGARDWRRRRTAVYLKARGVPDRVARHKTGLDRVSIKRAKWSAMDDMIRGAKKIA